MCEFKVEDNEKTIQISMHWPAASLMEVATLAESLDIELQIVGKLEEAAKAREERSTRPRIRLHHILPKAKEKMKAGREKVKEMDGRHLERQARAKAKEIKRAENVVVSISILEL